MASPNPDATPVPTLEEVLKNIRHGNQYRAETIPLLQSYVDEELRGQAPYSDEANQALLHLYQLYPDSYDPVVVRKVLSLALVKLPLPDFSQAMNTLPTWIVDDSPDVQQLSTMEDMLQKCRFAEFWDKLSRNSDDLKELMSVPGLKDSVNAYAAEVISLSFSRVFAPALGRMLCLDPAGVQFETFLTTHGWEREAGNADVVCIAPMTAAPIAASAEVVAPGACAREAGRVPVLGAATAAGATSDPPTELEEQLTAILSVLPKSA
eukprot:GHVU01078004.1.p1 GENE.GHVU01078004.1~~GHVU01078004.1.p1  ORF type:complete len:265 (+),score=51.98 GHVU01078004.1:390-1184(+)